MAKNGNQETAKQDPFFYFLPKDIIGLDKTIRDLNLKIKNFSKESALTANECGAKREDNPEIAGNATQLIALGQQLFYYTNLRKLARVEDPKQNNGFIALGLSTVVFDINRHKVLHLKIGSYRRFPNQEMSIEKDEIYKEISYSSPLGKILIHKKVDEKVTGIIDNQKKMYIVQAIELVK